MHENNAQNRYCWDELAAEELLAILHRFVDQGIEPVSGFVDTHQWAQLSERAGVFCSGGFPQAQFRRISLDLDLMPLKYLRLELDQLPKDMQTARQLRSWLYRNGVPDSSIGDIIAGDHVACVVDPRVDIEATGLPFTELTAWHAPEVEAKRSTAASRRADAVISTAFGVSRGEAQTAVKHGFVFVNFKPLLKRTRDISAGEQLVYRTKGRAAIFDMETNPRSGRVWVNYQYYPA